MMGGMRPGQHPGGQPMPPGGGRGAGGQPPPPYHHRAPTPMVGFNTNPSMMQPGMSMHPGMGQMRGPMAQVMSRLKMAKTDEEKTSVFQELKKTPHLFAAFIKMKPTPDGNWPSNMGPGGPGGPPQPGYYGGPPPPQGAARGPGGQFAPMGPGSVAIDGHGLVADVATATSRSTGPIGAIPVTSESRS
ncbi:hypothetical protein ANCCEY_02882 [Ancylostoma ceylanicum]|uniref:Uncharacterized protein n=1 Tax=Ancylostoma ceylanicum TaxID=53326 RepID=A0A0D6M3G7_9BILA|nr:hypothetical protein ANCCEY_02882 [Ancylostoma ceylanicum]